MRGAKNATSCEAEARSRAGGAAEEWIAIPGVEAVEVSGTRREKLEYWIMPERAGANASDDEGRRFSAMAEILDRPDSVQERQV